MINKSFQNIKQEDIENLVKDLVPESRTLDYKKALPDDSWQSKIEFLQDVSAFANASGGDLIFGIEEQVIEGKKTGIPKGFVGLNISSIDETKRRLYSVIRSGIQPPLSVQIDHRDGLPHGPVLLVRVPASWAAPHMITLSRPDLLKPQFYMRHNVENLAMDIDEIRSAFNLSENRIQRLRRFSQERLSLIIAKDSSVPHVHEVTSRVILHILPISATDSTATINLTILEGRKWQKSEGFPTWGGKCWSNFNFDGYLIQNFGYNIPEPMQYVQIFRTGAIETVRTQGEEGYIENLEVTTIRRVRHYLSLQRELEVQLPIVIMPIILGAKDKYLIPPPKFRDRPQSRIDRNLLPLPECVVDDFDAPLAEILRPAFDALYQDTGFAGCPNYDENGQWTGENI
jgi:hypothetical protein